MQALRCKFWISEPGRLFSLGDAKNPFISGPLRFITRMHPRPRAHQRSARIQRHGPVYFRLASSRQRLRHQGRRLLPLPAPEHHRRCTGRQRQSLSPHRHKRPGLLCRHIVIQFYARLGCSLPICSCGDAVRSEPALRLESRRRLRVFTRSRLAEGGLRQAKQFHKRNRYRC